MRKIVDEALRAHTTHMQQSFSAELEATLSRVLDKRCPLPPAATTIPAAAPTANSVTAAVQHCTKCRAGKGRARRSRASPDTSDGSSSEENNKRRNATPTRKRTRARVRRRADRQGMPPLSSLRSAAHLRSCASHSPALSRTDLLQLLSTHLQPKAASPRRNVPQSLFFGDDDSEDAA